MDENNNFEENENNAVQENASERLENKPEQKANMFKQDEAVNEKETDLSESGMCKECGSHIEEGQTFCSNCGASTKQTKVFFCSNCGEVIYEGQEFCPKCGKRIEAAADSGRNKKKKIIAVAVVILAAVIIGVIILKGPSVEKITISNGDIDIKTGETQAVEYEIQPEKAADTKVVWKSSDDTVAYVDEEGNVTAAAEGTCTITVKAGRQTDSIEVTVKDKPDFIAIYKSMGSPSYASAGSDGSYLNIDTNPYNREKYSDSEAVAAILVVNSLLGLPESLTDSMSSTNALMGRQSVTYSNVGISVSWSYHPDNGLEVTYALVE